MPKLINKILIDFEWQENIQLSLILGQLYSNQKLPLLLDTGN